MMQPWWRLFILLVDLRVASIAVIIAFALLQSITKCLGANQCR